MRFSREMRLGRIDDLLSRFPEAAEVLGRYRDLLLEGKASVPEPPSEAPGGPESPSVPSVCPDCGSPPGLSVLFEELGTHGGARRLICERCENTWAFPRIVCPRCGEEDRARLPRFQAEEIPAARIEACDACGTYLKAIDLTRDARAVPVVDDLATCALDLVARARGYRRVGDRPQAHPGIER